MFDTTPAAADGRPRRHVTTEGSDRSVARRAALPGTPISECNEFITSLRGTFYHRTSPTLTFE
ncbi:hypothetical protein GFS60_00010 [Rhodococcus sp. WAY2]|nr:hypothetical protein GFS60_00010 [Rhodococcus sp. WAY2]